MKLEYSLYVLIYPLVFGLLQKFLPDLPLEFSSVVFQALFAYVLTKLGVVIGEPSLRAFFVRRGFRGFIRG